MTEVLLAITEKLGIVSEQVFKIFVDAQLIIGVMNIIGSLIIFLSVFLTGKYVWEYTKKVELDTGERIILTVEDKDGERITIYPRYVQKV